MKRTKWLGLAIAGLMIVGLLALGACGGDDESGTPTGEASPEGSPAASPEGSPSATGSPGAESETPGPDAVTVKLETLEGDEWDISTDTDPLPAGQIIFEITNPAGNEFEHEVEILQGASGTDQEELAEVADIQPGETKELVITLEAGSYELACNINEEHEGEEIDHYERGMHRDVEVAAQ